MLGARMRVQAGRLAGLLLVVGMCLAAGPARADAFAEGAGNFIASLADKAVAALTDKNTPRAERIRRFRVLLNEHFAVETIGRWVLGRYWSNATDAERKEYLALFEDLIVLTYVDRFTEYSGEKLTVIKSVTTENKDVVVFSTITRPNQPQPIQVDWRIRAREGKYKIIDVMVEGISMGMTQRSEFAAVLSRNGGSMETFLAELRTRVKQGS